MTVIERVRIEERSTPKDPSPIREAIGGQKGVRREVTLIRAGWGSSGYYSEDVLRRDGPKAFPVGTHMYLDHPTLTEDEERPERSVKDLAATIVETPRMAGIDLVAVCELKENWKDTINAIAEDIGLSIRAYGTEEYGDAAGRSGPIITSLVEGVSVDFVTKAGAGGSIGRMIEESRKEAPVEEALVSDVRENLASAATERWGGDDVYVYCEDFDVDANWAIFWVNPDDKKSYYLKISFTRDSEGNVTFTGEPETVDREVNYVKASEAERPNEVEGLRSLEEARNVLHWLEASIHNSFTNTADRHFAQGYLTREERIGLSQAIGEGLQAFTANVEENFPHLLERDPYTMPGETDTSVSENDRSGGPNNGGHMADDKGLSELQESFRQFKEDTERRLSESETKTTEAEARAERAEEALDLVKAGRVVESEVGEVEGLPATARRRVIESVLRKGVPTTSDGSIDSGVLQEGTRAAIREEQDYIKEAAGGSGNGGGGSSSGFLTGLGESQGGGLGSASGEGSEGSEDELASVLESLSGSEKVGKIAAAGRVTD